jgi:FixJ family two-component response regulator
MVLLAEREDEERERLRRLVRAAGHSAEAFAGGGSLLARLSSLQGPCCVVSDMEIPELAPLRGQPDALARGVLLAVVFLTSKADVPTAVLAMKRGAIDVLEKPVRRELLLEAIASGLECARRLAESRRKLAEIAARFEYLTRREREVFTLVTSGRVNKEVAVDLRIAVKTVKVHRARVMQKMQAPSLAHLVRMAGLVGISELP